MDQEWYCDTYQNEISIHQNIHVFFSFRCELYVCVYETNTCRKLISLGLKTTKKKNSSSFPFFLLYAAPDYRCENRKIGELRSDIAAILDRSWVPFSVNPDNHPTKTNRSAKRGIWGYHFQARVWNCQILNHVVESQFVTSWWNRYRQWLSGIKLNQSTNFSVLLQDYNPCSTAGKQIGVWYCHAACEHPKTTLFTSIVYGFTFCNHGEHITSSGLLFHPCDGILGQQGMCICVTWLLIRWVNILHQYPRVCMKLV